MGIPNLRDLSTEEKEVYWRGEIDRNPIQEVGGLKVIVDEHGHVLFDHNNQSVSPDSGLNSDYERARRTGRGSINDTLGGHFFVDDGK